MRYFYFAFALLLFPILIRCQTFTGLEEKYRLAQSYQNAGQLEKAETLFREISTAQPGNYNYFDSFNRNLISQKKYKESVELINGMILRMPGDFNLFGLLGSTFFMAGDQKSAYESWEKGIEINPESFIAYRVIANYAIENRAFDKAIDFLNRGKKYSDDKGIFTIDLANIYAVTMRFKEAAAEFCTLIARMPEQEQMVKSRMANYLSRPDAIEQTVETVKDYISSKPLPEYYDLLSFVYKSSGHFDEALKVVEESEKRYANNGLQIFLFAQEALRSRSYDSASAAYEFLLKNYPLSGYIPQARIGYAKTLEAILDDKYNAMSGSWKPIPERLPLFADEYKKILSAYREFTESYPDNSVKTEALFRMAEIYRTRLFDYRSADSLYEKTFQLSPGGSYGTKSLILRGMISIINGDLRKGSSFFSETLFRQPVSPNDSAESSFYLAKIKFWEGNFDSSQKLLNEIQKNNSADFTNDALELSLLIIASQKDSLNLLRYAKADLLTIQNKLKEALSEFKALAENQNAFILNDFANIKIAEIFLEENNFSEAIKVLNECSESSKTSIFAEKSTILLAKCYQYGTVDPVKAIETYQKILEKFPNSLYFDRAREEINRIQIKSDK
jgi:tetratricopeptide (TPR) repeat protein